jgi:toxin ParE1/3/4
VSGKPLVRRRLARLDIEAAADYYDIEAGLDIAERFLDEVEACIAAILKAPGTGSPRVGELLLVDGLRSRAVTGFPYRIFYVEEAAQIEIWRVLHTHRDLTALLQADNS